MLRLSPQLAFAAATLVHTAAWAQNTTVETTADTGDDARHPTASVTNVELAPSDDVATAMDAVPGVHSRRTSYGQTAYVTIRGSNSRQVLVEYEGMRLNAPFGAGFDLGGSVLGFDSVSVWRGAAATYRGSGALAGALEFRTQHSRRPGAAAQADVLRGSHDTLAGAVDASVTTRDVSTRLAIGGRFSEGDFVFTDTQDVANRRVNNDHDRFAAFASSELRDGSAWLRTTAFADLGERGTPGLSEFQDQFSQARLQDQQLAAVVGVGDRELAEFGGFSLDGALRGGVQLRGYEYTNPEPFLGASPILESTRSTTASALAEGSLWSETAIGRTAIDVRYDDWRATTDAERTTAGLGTSWEQRLGERWLAVGAVRGELDSDGRTSVVPAIGGRLSATDAWRVQGNLGRTFRAPNLDELYLQLEAVRGNENLVSEGAWLGDLGLAFTSDVISASLTGFARVTDDEILFLPVTAYLVEAQNIDGTYAAGAEVEASLDLKPVRARLAYTFTHARFRETDGPIPLQPAHAADARVTVEPIRALELWTGATLRGPQTLDLFGNTRDDPHLFWDAGLSFGDRPARMALTVRNVLDDNSAVDALQHPMPGRTFWASVRVRWDEHE